MSKLIKLLEKVKSVGIVNNKDSMIPNDKGEINTNQAIFLLKKIILEQQKQIDNLTYKIALLNGEVED
jgi:hypothetical protein